MPLRADLDSLLLYDPSRARSTVNVWVARPSTTEDPGFGKLFLISAIDSAAHVNHEIIGIIQEELRTQFYRPEAQTFERRFEETLQATNRRLHSLVADGVNDWVTKSHFMVGAVQGSHLILAPVRSVHAYLLRSARLHDIIGVTEDAAPNPLRIFSQVITGHMEVGDRLLVCLPSLLDYFSLEKLRRTVIDHTPAEGARLLEQSLVDVDPSMSFGALLFSFAEAIETVTPVAAPLSRPAPAATHRQAPQRSMDELIGTERSTEKILAPSVWPAVREVGSALGRNLDRLIRTVILRRPPRRTLHHPNTASVVSPAAQISASSSIKQTGSRVVAGIGTFGHLIWTGLSRIWSRRPKSTEPKIPSARPSAASIIANWWLRTTKPQRLIAAGIVAVIIIFTSFVTRNQPINPTSSNKSTASDVEVQIERADAALRFGGESVAQEAVAAAEARLAGLPNKSKDDRATRDQLAARITVLHAKLDHVVDMPAGQRLADLATSVPDIAPLQQYLTGTWIVSYDPDRELLARVDRTTGEAKRITPSIDVGRLLTGTVLGTNIVFITDRPGLIEYAPKTDTWKPFDVTFPTDRPTVQAVAAFEQRLYLLDRTGNRLLRYTRAGSSYGTSTNWLKESADFSSTRSFAVDGSVYILKSNGVVEEYFNGRRAAFNLKTINPPASNLTRLWTNAASASLYLLDPDHQRILVFDKNGALRRQLHSNEWTDLRDMTVDEAGKLLYVQQGSLILKYELPSEA